MRYGPNTADVEQFLAWLAETDAERVRLVLDNDPRPRSPETKAALDRHYATPGLGAAWVSAAEKDWLPIYGQMLRSEIFATQRETGLYRILIAVVTNVLIHRDKLAPEDVDLILRPFTAAGFVLPAKGQSSD